MKPTCESRDEWLGPLLYRDLPFDVEMAADEHLRDCAACRAERAALESLVKALPPAPPLPAPRRAPWVRAAAALLIAVAIGFVLGRFRDGPTAPAAAASAPTVSLFSPDAAALLARGGEALPPARREALARALRE